MEATREQVIEYLAKLDRVEQGELDNEVYARRKEDYDKKYRDNQRSYKKQVEKHNALGELMKITVVPGDIVKCRGTRDREGIREVIECKQNRIVARKIERQLDYGNKDAKGRPRIYFVRAEYITNHGWDKVAKILNIKITEENEED